jgi:hypothetical protein
VTVTVQPCNEINKKVSVKMLNFFVDFLTVFPHGRQIFELMVVFYVEAISSVDNFCGSSGLFVF